MTTYRIDHNWGIEVVTQFTNGGNAKIVAKFTGKGWEQNRRDAEAFVKKMEEAA